MSQGLVQVVDEQGAPVKDDADLGLEPEELRAMLRAMMEVRLLDERCMNLQRQGRIHFYVPSTGEEACQIGSVSALRPDDWIVPTYRAQGACLWRGYPVQTYVDQLYGNADDATVGRQMPNHYCDDERRILSVSSPIATQLPQAVGIAYGQKLEGEDTVTAAYLGDGATSEGDFHTAMNFAGVWDVPCVFFCANNQWAITVPVEKQTAAKSIAAKAGAYGFEGVRVDGNDVLAVHKTVRAAVSKARDGGGPTLVEAVTYRMGAHSTSDDPRRYRDDEEVEAWKEKDPIRRFRAYLESRDVVDEAWVEEQSEAIRETVREAVEAAEKKGPPPRESLFDDVYETPTWHQEEGRRILRDLPPAEEGH